MSACFHCGSDNVIWDCDFSFEDLGYDSAGIVHQCHCPDCGCEIEYKLSFEEKGYDE